MFLLRVFRPHLNRRRLKLDNKQPSKPKSRLTFDEEVSLCKEVMMTNLFSFPKGSPKRTPIWEQLATKMTEIT